MPCKVGLNLQQADADTGGKSKRLDMVRWIAAYQNFALAAAATEVCFTQTLFHAEFKTQALLAWQVWPYTAAMAHLRICMEIATSSVSENAPCARPNL